MDLHFSSESSSTGHIIFRTIQLYALANSISIHTTINEDLTIFRKKNSNVYPLLPRLGIHIHNLENSKFENWVNWWPLKHLPTSPWHRHHWKQDLLDRAKMEVQSLLSIGLRSRHQVHFIEQQFLHPINFSYTKRELENFLLTKWCPENKEQHYLVKQG